MSAETLVEVLRRHAEQRPERVVFTWLEDGERETGTRSLGDLDARARAIGSRLAASVAPGQRALLLYDQGLPFIDAFFGCLYAGVIPVPTAAEYVRPEAALARLAPIIADATPAVLMTDGSGMAAQALSAGVLDAHEAAGAVGIPMLDTSELGSPDPAWEPVPARADGVAYLQYTSGSTGAPRGVAVSHANVMANFEMCRANIGTSQETVIISWVPMFHDLGLVGFTLLTVADASHCLMMSPVAFVLRPLRWLQAITRYRADVSGAPNFAYDLAVRRIPADAREGLDLSSWRRAFNGGEAVLADTLDRFAAEFAPHGFDPLAYDPVYGLAEATLFAAGAGYDGARTVTLDPTAAREDRLELATAGLAGRRLVSAGQPAPGVTIRIVDPQRRQALPEDEVGEIWVAGANVAAGYWERPEDSGEVFGQKLPGDEGMAFLRTGDLGFLHDGELYVTGRIKDLIIVRGRNHHPRDLELTAERSHPGLRPGGGAAFSVVSDEERVILVHEIRPDYAQAVDEITAAVRREVAREHGVTLAELVCVPPGRLRKTTSGKTMRHAMRREYLAGELAFDPATR
jgi:acyl-CoA synthetase (AMP-forming)/AMP-acid ligase II